MTDELLSRALTGAQQGDEQCFREIYRTVAPPLLRYLRVLVGDDADDVASETWLQIARDLSKFRGDADGFRGWCTSIGRNRAMDHVRRRRSRPIEGGVDVRDLLDLPGPDDTERTAIELVDGNAALALIATLPPDQAEAVTLRVIVGLDAKGAAAVLGKRPGAVRAAAHRGLRALAKHLTEGGVVPPLAALEGAR